MEALERSHAAMESPASAGHASSRFDHLFDHLLGIITEYVRDYICEEIPAVTSGYSIWGTLTVISPAYRKFKLPNAILDDILYILFKHRSVFLPNIKISSVVQAGISTTAFLAPATLATFIVNLIKSNLQENEYDQLVEQIRYSCEMQSGFCSNPSKDINIFTLDLITTIIGAMTAATIRLIFSGNTDSIIRDAWRIYYRQKMLLLAMPAGASARRTQRRRTQRRRKSTR
jgi:hypothetical protein